MQPAALSIPSNTASTTPLSSTNNFVDNQNESQVGQSTLSNIRSVLNHMAPRLSAYQAVRAAWEVGDQQVWQAISFNEEAPIHPIDSLDPGPQVNHHLSEFVGSICLREYSQNTVDSVLQSLTSVEMEQLRNLSLFSEESLEKSALKLIFQIFDHYSFDEIAITIRDEARQLMCKNDHTPLQLAQFKSLVFNTPKLLKAENPELTGEPFIYFNNYTEIVDAELQLLTQELPGKTEPLFSQDLLNQQHFAFVGAGFPLTAVILHIKTGAQIVLVDMNAEAVENGKKLLEICEKLGIIMKGSMKIVHANAEDCLFIHSQNLNQHTLPQNKHIVPVSILDLASALPVATTAKVIENCTTGPVIIRKRNVDGMPQLLYPKYEHQNESSYFKLKAKVVPPYYPTTNQDKHLIIGNAGRINVNSCQLFLRE